jgi:glycosyltransferase involved in cell wall biosynthesis
MDIPKVSVIIPVYNTEAYVEESLRCIINQTLRDIEIIVVNDGSTDKSLDIINNLVKEDNRIHIINQQNQGPAVARNTGITNATGEYVYFMDSDDKLEKESLNECYIKCKKNQLDLVIFDADIFFEDKNDLNSLRLNYSRKNNIEDTIYSGHDIFNILIDNHTFRTPLWLNFFKLDILNDKNLRFHPGLRYHDDELFTTKLFLESERVGYIPKAFFKRRIRKGSIMTSQYSLRNLSDYYNVAEQLLIFSDKKNIKTKTLINKYIEIMLNAAVYRAHTLRLSERIQILITCLKSYRKYVSIRTMFVLMFKYFLMNKNNSCPQKNK